MKYPTCTLANILNPGKYCVVSTDTEHVEEIKALEQNMKEEMQSDDTSECHLSCQMCVAVKDFTGQLRRGIIEKKLDQDMYQVLLMDYGRIVQINKSNIKVITNKSFTEVEPLAFLVRLYGLIPTNNVHVEGIKKPKACKDWNPDSYKFVRCFLKDDEQVIIKNILIQQRTVYGDLFVKLQPHLKFTSLRKLLCRQQFCIYSESNFLRLEGLRTSYENSEKKLKMELVEKWQKENFGEVQNSANEFSSASSVPNTCTTEISFNSCETTNTNNLESFVDQPKRLGLGRGKLKLLIAEMKNKERLKTVGRSDSLKETDVDEEQTKTVVNEIPSEVEEAIAKHDAVSDLNDSNDISKVSLIKEDDPLESYPLLRAFSKAREESKQSSRLITKPPNKSAGTNDSETTSKSTYSEESRSFKSNFKLWNQPLSLMKFSNCWAPYVAFEDTIVEPVNTFKELPIQLSIIQNLEKEGAFHDLSQVQRWAIPAIRKQHNTVIIGSSRTGKTLSYIVPLIDYVQDSTYFEELPQGNGPFIVIMASSSRVCESIYYMCHLLLGNFTKMKMKKCSIKIILAHGNGCEKEVWVNLTNGCDILISTPHCLVRLLEHPILTNFERLTCLVLDEIDIISQNPFRKNVRIILEKADFATKDRHYQSILTGERWTPNVESLVKTYVKSYALIIGSSAEAVIFKKLKPNIHLVDRQQKSETLLNLLEDRIKNLKTLVVCEGRAEASRLHDFLTGRGISSYVAHQRITADSFKEIHSCWKTSMESVLIITDEVLNELNIREAQVLVHFELPTKSKTNFYLRYTTLEGFLWNNFLKTKDKDFNVQSIILVDDENHRQLPHIIDFVTRLGGKIPSKILGKCEEIRRVIEIEKSDTPICQNLLSIGRCRNSKDCHQRHALVKALDSSTDLPTSGWVNFVVLKIQHASCFYVQLVEHVDLEGKSSKIENRRLELLEKVAKFFKSKDNQRTLGVAKCGDVCAVKSDGEDEEVFHRAKVVEILKVDKHGKAFEVNVKLLDEGDVWKRKSTQLFELPTDLSSHPPTATDVWVVGIQPMDFDVAWSAIANEFVSNLMTQKLQNNQYWSGKIVLALNNTLFLDPIKRKEFLPLLKTHVFDLVVQGELLNKGIAVANNEHLPALLKLCTTGDIDVPKKDERKKEDLAVVQPQWAFFDSNFIRVTFLAAENTSTVFLQTQKFEKLLQNLEEDCQKEAAEVKSHKTKKSKLVGVTVGMFCLALFEDEKWNRGRIESENETQFYVFFIDHGDFLFVSKTDVIPISQTLLLRLPAQAIECSLVGIHSEEECPVEVLREIYSFSDDGKEDLYAYIVDKNLEPSITNGRKYKLNLLNMKGISLNKILVDKGMVRVDESEGKHLEDIEIGGSDNDEEKEEEEENFKGGKESWESHFNNLTDDMFESEEALEFLKEFASKFLPKSPPFRAAVSNKETHPPLQRPQIAFKAQEKTPVKPGIQEETQITSEIQQKTPIKRDIREELTPEIQHKTLKDMEKKLKLKTRENVLTPQVLWCQNQLEVQIKIVLGNVEDYNLECTIHNLSFRCFVKEKFYAVDLKLFGAVNPQMTKVTIKAFHVVVVLAKLSFPLWPRLNADEGKHRWINLDVESLVDKEGVFSDKIESAKVAIEAGLVKKGIRSGNLQAYSDSEEEINIEEDEENEDFD